jgi:hypothetical protein
MWPWSPEVAGELVRDPCPNMGLGPSQRTGLAEEAWRDAYRLTVTFAGFAEPPAIDAHRRLVEAALAQYLELPLTHGDYQHGNLHLLWQEAERAQRKILGGWEAEARDAVERLVQHAVRLAGRAEWFRADLGLRRLAVEETIVHEAYGWTVASQEAQVKWRHLWLAERTSLRQSLAALFSRDSAHAWLDDLHSGLGGSGELRTADLLEPDWLRAWWRWLHEAT